MCKCEKNNCGCSKKTVEYKICNECSPQPACDCPIRDLSTNCSIYTGDDLSCSGIKKGTVLTDLITQLDEYICTAISQISTNLNLINIGSGAEIYKGVDNLGRRTLRTITSTNSSITIVEGTDTIDISVPAVTFDQDNFVRQILIDEADLPSFPYLVSDIIDYILALPSADRTIDETTSKVNVITYTPSEGGIFVYRIYEIQNIGKGVITTLTPDNLLLLRPDSQGFQDVLNVNSNLTGANTVNINQTFRINSGSGGNVNGLFIFDPAFSSPTIPIIQLGKAMGNSSTDVSLNFFPTRTVFIDALNLKGLEYAGDYESNFTARSLITRKFLEDAIAAIPGADPTVINAGTNISVSGAGTSLNPYIISNTQTIDGSETKLSAGTNISITGAGTTLSPYVITNNFTVDGSETKINSGITTTVTGTGTTGSPYIIETKNLQKSISADYTLTSADNNYSIKVNNGGTPVTITVPTGLPENFFAGITQKGTADVTIAQGSGVTISNPIGFKIKGQGYCVGIEQIGATDFYDLLADTKV